MMSNVNIFIWFISDRTFEPPLTWSAMDDKVNLKMVQLSTTDQGIKMLQLSLRQQQVVLMWSLSR